jgi:tetratricopeptide repeat protein
MRITVFLLFFSAILLSGYDIQPDAGPREPLRSEPVVLSGSAAERAAAMAEFSAFINGVIATRGKTPRQPDAALLDRLYLAVEKDPRSEELIALLAADLADPRTGLPDRLKRLAEFAKKHPENERLNFLLVSHLARNPGAKGDEERKRLALELIEAIRENEDESLPADSMEMERLFSIRLLQALLYTSQKRFDEAEKTIDGVLKQIPEKRRLKALQTAMGIYLEAQKNASDEKLPLIGFLTESDKERFSRKFEEVSQEFIRLLSAPETEVDPDEFQMSTAIFGQEGKTDYSLLILTRPLFADPDSLSALRRLAAFYYSNKQYANAARAWARVRALGGGRVQVESYLHAFSLLRSGNAREAHAAFAEHYKRFPRDVKSLTQYALAAWMAEDYAQVPGIIAAIPDPLPELLYLKAFAEQKNGQYGAALEDMLKYERKQKWPDAEKRTGFRMQTAMVADKAKRFDVAEKILLPMIAEDPENPELLNFLGYLYAERGVKLDKALELLESALKSEPGNPAILDSMAWALYRRKEYGKALEYIGKALAASPSPVDPVILDHAGDIHSALGDRKKAAEFWRRALETYSPELDTVNVLRKLRDSHGVTGG